MSRSRLRGLVPQLVLRVTAASGLTLLLAIGWLLWDTGRAARMDAASTADRVARVAEARPDFMGLAFGGVAPTPVFKDWQSFPSATAIAPGICVEMRTETDGVFRRCGPYLLGQRQAPGWFLGLLDRLQLFPDPEIRRPRSRSRETGSTITAVADRAVTAARAWDRMGDLLGMALGMAAGGALLTGLLVARLLAPVRAILDGLSRLQRGDYQVRQPRQSVAEFDALAHALDDAARALQDAQTARASLTRQLFTVQESERRALARELHDDFGQSLTATRALATAIAQSDEPTARDGAMIAEIAGQMMDSLRGELQRLRPPELDDLGLVEALQRMIADWRRRVPKTRFEMAVTGTAVVADDIALSLYRIAQECLTNAMRHGQPRRVRLTLDLAPRITLTVADDGGRRAFPAATGGQGILGIQERLDALGGSFALTPNGKGMTATARIDA